MTVVFIFILILMIILQIWARRRVAIITPEFESLRVKDTIPMCSLISRATGQGLVNPHGVSFSLMAPQVSQKYKTRITTVCVRLFESLSPIGCYFHLSLELYSFLGRKKAWLQGKKKVFLQILFYYILKVFPVLDTILSAVKNKNKNYMFNSRDSPVNQLLLQFIFYKQ